MLRPVALQGAIQALVDAPESPADLALLVLSDCGGIYAQAHRLDRSRSGQDGPSQTAGPSRAPLTEIQRLQLQHQPGLTALMPTFASEKGATANKRRVPARNELDIESMPLGLSKDERAHVVAGVACQSWTEELARVRRLRTGVQGRFPIAHSTGIGAPDSPAGRSMSGSSSVLGETGKGGSRLHQHVQASSRKLAGESSPIPDSEDEVEQVEAPVAIVGSAVHSSNGQDGIAPLMLETELGAMLVMPLTSSESSALASLSQSIALTADVPLLLVLASYPRAAGRAERDFSSSLQGTAEPKQSTITQLPALGSSILSHAEWNELHETAQSFADVVSPALRHAFNSARLAHDGADAEDAHATGSVAGLDAHVVGGQAFGHGGAAAAMSNGQASRSRKARSGAGGTSTVHAGLMTDTRASTTVFSDDRESTASVGPGPHDHSGMSF